MQRVADSSKGGIQIMRYVVILLIVIVAGYYLYQHVLAPTPENFQKTLTRKWFNPESSPYPEFKTMVDHFDVAPDFSVTVYLSDNFRMMSDSPGALLTNLKDFINTENAKHSAPVKFVFQGKEIPA
jgi:hypothetical protein